MEKREKGYLAHKKGRRNPGGEYGGNAPIFDHFVESTAGEEWQLPRQVLVQPPCLHLPQGAGFGFLEALESLGNLKLVDSFPPESQAF